MLPSPILVVASETFRFFHPNNNTYIVGVEARRFDSFPHWLLEARRFASFLHWLLEAKHFASFTQTTIHILLWAWKRDVSLPSPIGCWKRDVSLPSSIGCWKRNVSLLLPKQQYIYCGRGSETFRFHPPLVVGSETFRFFHPNNNTYIVGVEARRFASFPHWLLEARRFASFLYWLLEAKRFASFTQTTIHILWAWKRDVSLPSPIGWWKRDVSLPSPIGCWKRDVSLPSSIGCLKRNVSLLSPKQQYIYCGRGSETFRFLSPSAMEAECFASARAIMERTTRFQKHIMFEGILSHIMPSANCPIHSISTLEFQFRNLVNLLNLKKLFLNNTRIHENVLDKFGNQMVHGFRCFRYAS